MKLNFTTPQAMFAWLQADMAVYVLQGLANQANLIGQPVAARSFADFAATIGAWRDEFHRTDQARVVLAGPADVPVIPQ